MNVYYAIFLPEEGGVSVYFPDLPGCVTCGNTVKEAFIWAMDALEGHLEALAEDGDMVPAPSSQAAAWQKALKEAQEDGEPLSEDALLHPVPAPDVRERPRRVNVSFSRSTLGMIDRKAEKLGMTRSGFLAKAAKEYQIRED